MTFALDTDLQNDLAHVKENLHEIIDNDEKNAALKEVIDSVMERTGKMVRPLLLLIISNYGNNNNKDVLYKLGAFLELVHLASLIHDDIIDDSPLRRGKKTTQAQFGKDIAVLAGDYLLSRVLYQIIKENLQFSGLILADAVKSLCSGEIRQLGNRFNLDTTIEDYYAGISEKTASLFVAACHMGAYESGCDEQTINKLIKIGHHFGYVFQIRDDLLDFVSCQSIEGKPVHKDVLDGIYTLPVLFTLQVNQYGNDLRLMLANIRSPEFSFIEMEKLIIAAGGISNALDDLFCHVREIYKIIDSLPANKSGQFLKGIADWLVADLNFGGENATLRP